MREKLSLFNGSFYIDILFFKQEMYLFVYLLFQKLKQNKKIYFFMYSF